MTMRHPRSWAAFIRRRLARFVNCTRGGIVVEFAFALPVLVTAALSAIDITDYILAHQKMERVAIAGADLVAQAEDITTGDLANIWIGLQATATPHALATKGRVIITSVSRHATNGTNIINWQRSYGSLNVTSAVGTTAGAVASVPANMISSSANYTLVVAETFYDYTPRLVGWLFVGTKRITHRSYFRARLGSLKTVGS
jgi:Flp pilus assembly protein TadG